MPVQKQRHTRARRDRARVQYEITPKNLVKCAKCGAESGRIQSVRNAGTTKEKKWWIR